MKNLLLFLILSMICISCDPSKYMDSHYAYWYLKNSTAETLIVARTRYNEKEIVINPGDSDRIFSTYPPQHRGVPSFELFYRIWERTPEEDLQHIDLLSTDKKLLKRWRFADKDNTGRELFNETDWILFKKKTEGVTSITCSWVFDILPEDIENQNNHLK